MKIPTQKNLKTVAVIVCLSILLTSGFLFYTFAQTPSSTFTISGGIYPGSPTYTIWREGSNYFAKDENGLLAYSGPNASQVINQAWQPNTHILLKAGTYNLDARLNAEHNSILRGESEYSTTLYATRSTGGLGHIICHKAFVGGSPVPYGTPVENVTIQNLNFQANIADRADRGIWIRARNLTVKNCFFHDFDGYYVKAVYSENVFMLNNKGWDGQSDGFHILYTNNALIQGNDVYATSGDYIAVVHSNNTIVADNKIYGLFTGIGENGVDIWGNCHDVTVTSNIIKDMNHNGLGCKQYESKDPTNITFTDNKITHCGQYGLYLISTYSSNNSLHTINIIGNIFANINWTGIRILVASNGIIAYNHIINAGQGNANTYDGIRIDWSGTTYSNNWDVSHNQIRNTASTVKYGIYFAGGSYHVCIGNTVYGAGSTDIQDSSTGSIVEHNQNSGF